MIYRSIVRTEGDDMSSPNQSALVLPVEIREIVNSALADGAPLLLAAVSSEAKPVLSFRGSVQVSGDGQFGIWIRNGAGATLEAIRVNPNVGLVYRSTTTPFLQFHGRARIVEDESERAAVFERAPDRERAADPDRKGVAVIVDLDRVEGVLRRTADGPVFVRLPGEQANAG
jgi:hypothetical protein